MMTQNVLKPTQRVALVARGAAVAGGEVSLLALARHLPHPWRPILWVTEEGELSERAAAMGLEVVQGSWEFLSPRRPQASLTRIHREVLALEAHGVDLVHVNSPVEASAFLAAALWARRPSLVHVRIAYERDFLRTQGLGLADEVIFNSHALREEIGWAGGEVVPNGVELPDPPDASRRAALREQLGFDSEVCLIGQVGQVIETKGVDLSLRAFAKLGRREPEAFLLIVGDDHQAKGAYRERMEALAQELGVAERVRFLGYRRDAQDLMAALDLLLCPSRAEPFGRVLIEAMSQAVPSIATRVGGIPEVLVHQSEGMLVPSEDLAALSEALYRMVADPPLRRMMGRRGRARAEQHFSAASHAQRVAAIYERVSAPYLRGGELSG